MTNEQYKTSLREQYAAIMRYWIDKMQDPQGGFYGERDAQDNLVEGAPKGAILNGRILWSFASGALFFQNDEYKQAATRAFNYLKTYFYDKQNGGFYWSLNADGTPLDTKKQAYAQGFCIYGLSEYYRLTKDAEALRLAEETYSLIEKHFRDPKDGGYTEALAADWSPMADVRLSEKDENTPKSMNTHLHILEPYTNLYRANPTPQLRESIEHCIEIFTEKIIDPKTGRFMLFFDMDWTNKSNIDSYGHDIEGAWLLYEAAEVIDNKALMQMLKPIARRLVDITLEEGWDKNSIYYEKVDNHLDTDKHWWPQAEAIVGLADTWRLSGEEKYLELSKTVWNFIVEHIVDKQRGEWLWRVDKDNRAAYTDCKAGFWKCPYHNSRAIIEVLHRLG